MGDPFLAEHHTVKDLIVAQRHHGVDARGASRGDIAGEQGYEALELVDAVYRSCRTGEKVRLAPR